MALIRTFSRKVRELKMSINSPRNVCRMYDIPLITGSSVNGATVFIDKNAPIFWFNNGRKIDLVPFYIAFEKAYSDARKAGKDETDAFNAGVIAEAKLCAHYNIDPCAFSAFRFAVDIVKGFNLKHIKCLPPDLDYSFYNKKEQNFIKSFKKLKRARISLASHSEFKFLKERRKGKT